MDDALLRSLTPSVLGILVRRGADFASAEDAVQDALLRGGQGLAGQPAAGPEGLAGHGGLAAVPRRDPFGCGSSQAGVSGGRAARRAAGQRVGAGRGRHTPALLFVRAPVVDVVVRRRTHAARCRRADHPPDCAGLPGARGDYGSAHQPRPSARSPASGSSNPAMSPPSCVSFIWSSTRGTPATSTWLPRPSGSPGSWRPRSITPKSQGLLALMLLHHARRAARTAADGSLGSA